jgi:hypothetical protein
VALVEQTSISLIVRVVNQLEICIVRNNIICG